MFALAVAALSLAFLLNARVAAAAPCGSGATAASAAGAGGTRLSGTVYNPIFDVNKTFDTDPITGDSNLCWAAAAANVLAYGNWGAPATGNDAASIFADLNSQFTNEGGFPQWAWENYVSRYYPGPSLSPEFYASSTNLLALPSVIDDLLGRGYGVTIGIQGTTATMYHSITAWGTDRDLTSGTYRALFVTDSDDQLAGLQRYDLQGLRTRWLLPQYYAKPYISDVWALAPRLAQPLTVEQTLADAVPHVSSELAAYIAGFYSATPFETGIADAPITGFNGHVLTASDTGFDELRYLPGSGIGDQVAGNGIDELVAFSFVLPSFSRIDSAILTLGLTPRSALVSTDLLLFADNFSSTADNYGNALLAGLEVDIPTEIAFDLAMLPSSHGLVDLRNLLLDGRLDVLYGDDAIIRWASLEVRGLPVVSEPNAAYLLIFAVATLAIARRRRSFTA